MKKSTKIVLGTAAAITGAAVAGGFIIAAFDKKRYLSGDNYAVVDRKRMHISVVGEGRKVIVMLPTVGNPCPSLDYLDLAEALAGKFTCVIPEPFGYGHSDPTTKPRTVQNMVSELRRGLTQLGLQPPYILYGHGSASLCMHYWSARFPGEIEGLIGEDTVIPDVCEDREFCAKVAALGAGGTVSSVLRRIGIGYLPLCFNLSPRSVRGLCGGREELFGEVKALVRHSFLSEAVSDEFIRFRSNCQTVSSYRFPRSKPIIHFVSRDSNGLFNKMLRSGSADWEQQHELQTFDAERGKFIAVEGGSYLHWDHVAFMADEITDFFAAAPAPVKKVN